MGVEISASPQCKKFAPPGEAKYTLCNLDELGTTNNTRLAQRGDSGGPVATADDSDGARVLGTIVGMNSSGKSAFFHPHTHTVPPGWRVRTA